MSVLTIDLDTMERILGGVGLLPSCGHSEELHRYMCGNVKILLSKSQLIIFIFIVISKITVTPILVINVFIGLYLYLYFYCCGDLHPALYQTC